MSFNSKKVFFLLSFFLFIGLSGFAQRGWEVGVGGGVAYYFGDLNTNFRLDKPGPSANLFARYDFNKRINARMGLHYGQISASDADSDNVFEQTRNLSFRSHVFDAAGLFEFNFFPYEHGSRDNFYTPYIFGGIAVYNYNPQAELGGTWYDLREYGTEGQFTGEEYYTLTAALAYGMGFKVDLNFEWSLNLEVSARKLYTDYLDDVSTVYPEMDDLESLRGEIAPLLSDRSPSDVNLGQAGRQRGDSKRNDTYAFVNLSLVYYFGSVTCPSITRHR